MQKENIEKLTQDLNLLNNLIIGLEEKIVSIEQNGLQRIMQLLNLTDVMEMNHMKLTNIIQT